jgi:hypothetical protein
MMEVSNGDGAFFRWLQFTKMPLPAGKFDWSLHHRGKFRDPYGNDFVVMDGEGETM